jgi:tyrosine-protein kinase Etk/Wzc
VDGELAADISELRANVLVELAGSEKPILAVTSPNCREDRRRVAAHLAASLAQTGRRVLLVDADVTPDAPVLDEHVPSELGPGLTAIATEAVAKGDPTRLAAAHFLADLDARRAQFDFVVVACPPLLDVAEARTVAAACSAALLVVVDGESRRDQAVRAAAVLRGARVRVLGAVVQRRA